MVHGRFFAFIVHGPLSVLIVHGRFFVFIVRGQFYRHGPSSRGLTVDPGDLRTLLRRLARAKPGEGVLHLPATLPADLALQAIRAAARALGAEATLPADPSPPPEASAPRASARGARAFRIHIDGASRGNPGPAGIGVLILTPDGAVVEGLQRFIGRTTNNAAEYQALLLALQRALELGAQEVEILSDSELLVRQLRGQYQVRHPEMRRLFALAQEQIGRLRRFSVQHVPRALNAAADALANRGIDEGCRARRPAGEEAP